VTPILHLGSWDHERWSIQREVFAFTDHEVSHREASAMELAGRNVVTWCPGYWLKLPESSRRGSRAVCFFHHTEQFVLRDPDIVAGICMNRGMQQELQTLCPEKPVFLANVGGVEAACAQARREHPTGKIRLILTGAASAQLSEEEMRAWPGVSSSLRKSPELLLRIAERLDPARYAFVFVGRDWESYAAELRERGWTVINPGLVEDPLHYQYFGEGDIYLMLARLEGGPLPLLETMGLGIWPICTPVGMAPDIIRHGENGFLVTAYDGWNAEQVADETAGLIRRLDRPTLRQAVAPIANSVADRTWANFGREIHRILGQVFGPA
jgi:glycosyltransferase involved in cell wall biosynthesis